LYFWIANWKTEDPAPNDNKHSQTSICSDTGGNRLDISCVQWRKGIIYKRYLFDDSWENTNEVLLKSDDRGQ
jgi:hypothetical protein